MNILYDLDTLCVDCKLALCGGEKAAMKKALDELLDRLKVLDGCTQSTTADADCIGLHDLRLDLVLDSFSASEALSNATASKDGLFVAPKA